MAIQTGRLILRKFDVSDAKDFYELNSDKEVLKYTGDRPYSSINDAQEFIEHYDEYNKSGYGRLSIVLKDTSTTIGWCGLRYMAQLDEVDIGYRIKKEYWNCGYTTEAAVACIAYGFDRLNIKEIVGRSVKRNLASIRVLEKVGMTYWKDFEFNGELASYYKITINQHNNTFRR